MIQPVGALSPRAGFRGSKETYGKSKGLTNTQTAALTAGGVSVAFGGLMFIVSRAYTSSWAGAGVIAAMSTGLAGLLMLPKALNNKLFSQKKTFRAVESNSKAVPETASKLKSALKPSIKQVPFKQEIIA